MLDYKDHLDPTKLNAGAFEEMRSIRLKEQKAKKAIRDCLIYSIFIFVQFIVSFSKTDPNAYNYNAMLVQFFANPFVNAFLFIKNWYITVVDI
jgi:hypothetical protein